MPRRSGSRWTTLAIGVGLGMGLAAVGTLIVFFVLSSQYKVSANPPSAPTTPTPSTPSTSRPVPSRTTTPNSTRPTALPAGPVSSLRVGSWNIEWLGKASSRHSKIPQNPEDLARYIARSEVDVLGLNEITGDAENGTANATLLKAIPMLDEQTKGEWKHLLFPKESRTERDQLTGVLWNARRATLVGEPFRVPVHKPNAHQELWNRHPHAVKFSAGEKRTDVVLIPLHMKSNRGGKDTTSVQRDEEAKSLARMLGAVQNQFGDDDVILLGDCNCLKADEAALRRFAGVGLRDLNAGDEATWIQGETFDAAPFDRLFVPDDQPEFKASALRVMKASHLADEPEFRSKLSDHYMVLAEIQVTADDD